MTLGSYKCVPSCENKNLQCFSCRKNVWGESSFFYTYSDIAQHEVPCDYLEGVAHCTLLIHEHQAFSGVWLKLALSLLSY